MAKTKTSVFELRNIDIIMNMFSGNPINAVFDRIINDNPEYKSYFNDFTYYKNSVASYNYTQFAIPHIMTGIAYDNSLPYWKYLVSAHQKTALLKVLSEENFDNRVFTYSDMLPLSSPEEASYISNQFDIKTVDPKRIANTNLLTMLMYKFTAVRYFPVALKQHVWFYSEEFENGRFCKINDVPFAYLEKQSRDLDFYKGLTSNGFELINNKNAFRFYHLKGIHYPYNLNDKLELIEGNYSEDNLYGQAKATLKIAHSLIEQVKKAGVYDQTTIIIAADHGRVSNRRMALDYMSPLMLVKFPRVNQEAMAISNAPVTNGDIAHTILSLVGRQGDGEAKSILDITEGEQRTRVYYASSHFEKTRKQGYFQDFYEYITNESANDMKAWQRTGRIFTPEGILQWQPLKYNLGTKLTFEEGAEGYRWVTKGLLEGSTDVSFTEKSDYAFTTSVTTEFAFDVGDIATDLILSLELAPTRTANPQKQSLTLSVNGKVLKEEFQFNSTDGKKTIKAYIPRDYIDGRHLYLTLQHPNATEGQDMLIPYKQAFMIYWLSLERK
jgi:hypothetical protein